MISHFKHSDRKHKTTSGDHLKVAGCLLISVIIAYPLAIHANTCEGLFKSAPASRAESTATYSLNSLLAKRGLQISTDLALTPDQARFVTHLASGQSQRLAKIGIKQTPRQIFESEQIRLEMIARRVTRDDYLRTFDADSVTIMFNQYKHAIDDLDMQEYFVSAFRAFHSTVRIESSIHVDAVSLLTARRMLNEINFDRKHKLRLPEIAFEDFLLAAARNSFVPAPNYTHKKTLESTLPGLPKAADHPWWSALPNYATALREYLRLKSKSNP